MIDQVKVEEALKVGHHRDSRQYYFSDNPIPGSLEQTAKGEGLRFIDSITFENGSVYKGKSFRTIDIASRLTTNSTRFVGTIYPLIFNSNF